MAHVAITSLDHNQFGGPFEATDTGVVYKFHALFQDTATNRKVVLGNIQANIPDGTPLSQYRALIGQAIADAATGYEFTIPLANILLPQFQPAA